MTRRRHDYSAAPQSSAPYAGVDVSVPVAGHYRMKLRGGGVMVGIRIWWGPPADPVTGELLDRSYRWQAEMNGEPIDFDRVWPNCAAEPISEPTYADYVHHQQWARSNAPDTAHADPRRKLNLLTDPLPL